MAKPDKKQEAIQLRLSERLSNRTIAARLEVSSGSVSRWLRDCPLSEQELKERQHSGNSRWGVEPKFYVSEGVCRNGHVNPKRRFKSGACLECKRKHDLHHHFLEHRAKPEKHMWKNARSRAKRFGIPFDITVEDVRAVWPRDNRCPILGIPFEVGRNKGPDVDSPTLDRVVPKMGYVIGNIAVISKRANAMKNDETNPDNFRKLADWLEAWQTKLE